MANIPFANATSRPIKVTPLLRWQKRKDDHRPIVTPNGLVLQQAWEFLDNPGELYWADVKLADE